MIELDKKDKKILFYLLQDSRQSYKILGKKIGMSKELVSYRIKRLIKNRIILNFSIIINFERLGYALMQTNYKFINVNPEKKEEIIHFLVTNKHTMYVSHIEGIYDLQVEFYMGKPYEFEKLMDVIREKYSPYLIFKLSMYTIRAEFYTFSFLIHGAIKKKIVDWIWGQQLYDIDNLDFKILSVLSKNSRIPIKNLANDLNSTVSTINNRIKNMKEENIIALYTINVDWSKLGYRWFHLQISLKDYTKKNKIIKYMRENPYLIRRFKFLDLDMDLHFTLLLKNMEQLRTIIEELSTVFPNSINDYHFYSTFKVYKHNFMVPEIIKNKNPFNRCQSF
jgi:Lrp/AsnC family leucine-responsive transcriptional regulator